MITARDYNARTGQEPIEDIMGYCDEMYSNYNGEIL